MSTETEPKESWEDISEEELEAFVSDDDDVDVEELPGRYGCANVED